MKVGKKYDEETRRREGEQGAGNNNFLCGEEPLKSQEMFP